MNTDDYKAEVLRQLNNTQYYEKLNCDPSETIRRNISTCIDSISNHNSDIANGFDVFPSEIRTPHFYILPKTH
jgi:hypothetical protein